MNEHFGCAAAGAFGESTEECCGLNPLGKPQGSVQDHERDIVAMNVPYGTNGTLMCTIHQSTFSPEDSNATTAAKKIRTFAEQLGAEPVFTAAEEA
jgi:hypothetical protein